MDVDLTEPVNMKDILRDLNTSIGRLNRNMDKVIEQVYRMGYQEGMEDAIDTLMEAFYGDKDGNEDDEDVQDLPF